MCAAVKRGRFSGPMRWSGNKQVATGSKTLFQGRAWLNSRWPARRKSLGERRSSSDKRGEKVTDLSIKLKRMDLKNPLVAASGTYGFGAEASVYTDLSLWGAISSKGITIEPRTGNPPARVAETPAGMLNSVGLQNPGAESFIRDELPAMLDLPCRTVVNVAGGVPEDYEQVCRLLAKTEVPAIELNLSCPNVRGGCMAFGADPAAVEMLTRRIRDLTDKEIWVKLTPNITDITEAAKAAEAGGADGVSLINTLLGMAIDITSRRPVLRNNTGGLSGPAVKPVALRMVSEVYRAVAIPIIGMGGIMSAEDVVAFMLAGARAVQIGTANLLSPHNIETIHGDLVDWLRANGCRTATELTGGLQLWS